MTNTTIEERAAVGTPWTADLTVVGVAAAAAGAAWATWTQVLGVTLEAPVGGQVHPVGLASVLVSALVASAAGLGLLRLLEARTTHGLRLWTVAAAGVCLLSIGGPASAPTVDAMTGLASLHLVVALVLVVGLRVVRRGRRPLVGGRVE
jgi:hypothetical protein